MNPQSDYMLTLLTVITIVTILQFQSGTSCMIQPVNHNLITLPYVTICVFVGLRVYMDFVSMFYQT